MRNGRWAWIREQADQPNGLTISAMMTQFNIGHHTAWDSIKRYQADSSSPLVVARWARETTKHYFNTQAQAEAFMQRDPALVCQPLDGSIRITYRGDYVEIPRDYAKALLHKLQESLCE